jgi:hypothetical protein
MPVALGIQPDTIPVTRGTNNPNHFRVVVQNRIKKILITLRVMITSRGA